MDSVTKNNAPLKRARITLRTTNEAKEMLTLAAAISGMDLTSFVLGAAMDKARDVLSSHANIALSPAGQATLFSMLRNPQPPNNAMLELMDMTELSREEKNNVVK